MPPCGLSTCALLPHLRELWSSDCCHYSSTLVLQNDCRSPQPPCFRFVFCRFCPRLGALSFPLEEYVYSSVVRKLSRGLTNQWMTVSNTGTCLCMAWIAVGCLTQFINSVVWDKNVVNRAPVWCDICEAFSCSTSLQ